MTSPGGPLLQSLSGSAEPHSSLHLSNDGKTLVSIGDGNEILVWDVHAGRILRNIECPGRPTFYGFKSSDCGYMYSKLFLETGSQPQKFLVRLQLPI